MNIKKSQSPRTDQGNSDIDIMHGNENVRS